MRKLGFVLFVVMMLSMLMGCSEGDGNANENASSPSATSSINETPQRSMSPSPSPELPTQENAQEQEATPTTPAASSPEASESPKDQNVSEPEPSQSASPSTKPAVKPSAEPTPVTPVADTVSISIVGNADWGTVLAEEKIELSKEDTPSDVLIRAAKAHRLSYDIRGSGALTYIEGIDGLYEFDDGPTSGWKFRVNGEVASVGAGVYELKPGDRLEWFYGYEDSESEEVKESAS